MKRILVVIPAYNCAPQITRVIAQFNRVNAGFFAKVAIINNQSTDDTEVRAIQALKNNPHITGSVYTNSENLGYGGTLKTGFALGMEGGYDFLLILHGDDQGHIEDMLPCIKDGSIDDYDCTLGARFHPDSLLENYSAFRTFGNQVFNALFGIVLRKKVLDLGSGLNIYKLSAFSEKDFLKFPDNLTFDYCGLMSHCFRGRKIRFCPISWREDDQISNVKITRQALHALKLLIRYALNPKVFFEKNKMATSHLTYTSSLVFTQSGNEA